MKKENIDINKLSLKECLNRLINEDRTKVVEYFDKLKQAALLLSEIKFNCPVISQDMRQKIDDVIFSINELKTEWIDNGYVDRTDLSDVEFQSRYGNEDSGWNRMNDLREDFPTQTQIKNITGIQDDDELNAGVEAEKHEDLEQSIVMDLGRYEDKMLKFSDVCNLLKNKYGFEYIGGDDNNECHNFTNGTETVSIFPKIYYPKQGTMRLSNLHVSSK